jgi:hypothetical protein
MRWRPVLRGLPGVMLALTLLLVGCDPGGNQGSLSPSDSPSTQVEQQAIQRLLELYRRYGPWPTPNTMRQRSSKGATDGRR